MIGDGWDNEPSVRPGACEAPEAGGKPTRRRVAVVTGSRAEFGLLKPVMRAVLHHPELELLCIAAGSHLIQPAETFREIKAAFEVADSIPMQVAGRTGRYEDAEALGRGVGRFARSFDRLRPDWVVVLGDRIEAFAAASAAAVGGFPLAHIHGGDRAEGIADESMRHAISKLANLHFAATPASAERLVRMGERPTHIHITGSPAVDDIGRIAPLDDSAFQELGSPEVVFLFHPVGRHAEIEEAAAMSVLDGVLKDRDGRPAGVKILALHPNFDSGRDGICRAIANTKVNARTHLPREMFVGLLRRLAANLGDRAGVLVGNSSAGLIEAAVLKLPAVDVGPRQAGREHASNVIHCAESAQAVREAVRQARAMNRSDIVHPYGDGRAGERIADLLSLVDPADAAMRRKLNTY